MSTDLSFFALVRLSLFSVVFVVAYCGANNPREGAHDFFSDLKTSDLTQVDLTVAVLDANDFGKFKGSEDAIQTSDTREIRQRIKRQDHEIENDRICQEVQSPGGPGVHRIREIKHHGYTLYFKPLEDFNKLILNMIIDNLWNLNEPYISDDNITISKNYFEDWDGREWIEMKVEFYRNKVSGPDHLALKVTFRNRTFSMVTSRWWRTHTYEGFLISTVGGASFLFDCITSATPSTSVSNLNKIGILGGTLGACFLLVILGMAIYILIRRHPREPRCDKHAPKVPPLPASLLLGTNKVKNIPYPEHIYEDFDMDTLARLRQAMNPETLGKCEDPGKSSPHLQACDVAPRMHPSKATEFPGGKEMPGISPDTTYVNEIKISLIEEKLKTRCRDSDPESHYVEMHGIPTKSPTSPKEFGQ
ncbi:hypothetical protein SK128_000190 [Halocaridina rubra]|uniref:Uncharacterized protein n=1 Tax=Halocaridina rubra TaxID=373956 RepID=A0AAN8WII6_HALRR